MKRKDLKRMLKPTGTKTRYGTISKRINSRRFLIVDDNEFEFLVSSTSDWGEGTKVIVQNGFIIGTGQRSGTYKHYKL